MVFFPSLVFAQYNGGDSYAYSVTTLNQSACSPISLTNSIFTGGNSYVSTNVSFIQSSCAPTYTADIYYGGNSDGYAVATFTQATCSAPSTLSAIYYGGNSDGYAISFLTQLVCPAPTYNIYYGGNSDGYALTSFTQTTCSTPTPTILIYYGGTADGYALTNYTQTACASPTLTNFYYGGNSDGYALTNYTQSTCPSPTLTNFFYGGNSDGFALNSFTQSACPSLTITNLFTGGVADGFAKITYTQTCTVLPIELLSFAATCAHKKVYITWSTASQINCDFFTIERTIDGSSYQIIGTIAGAGNSNQTLQYTFTDEQPLYSVTYYRLKQTDYDKTATYSQLVDVSCNGNGTSISIYPNPSSGRFMIIGAEENAEITITNPMGKRILKQKAHAIGDEINLSQQSNGIYFIQISSEKTTVTQKVMVNR